MKATNNEDLKANNNEDLTNLVRRLVALPRETEWLEFKCNKNAPDDIGEKISALSNSAALHRKSRGYMIWGVSDREHAIVGTRFQPHGAVVGNENMEMWLATHLHPRVDFTIHEVTIEGKRVVVISIAAADHTPVRFKSFEYFRIGSITKKLNDFPEKERLLWKLLSKESFETGKALEGLTAIDAIECLDVGAILHTIGTGFPKDRSEFIVQLRQRGMVRDSDGGKYDITNAGAILFAKQLSNFPGLKNKAVRVIAYNDSSNKLAVIDQFGAKGYAAGFAGLLEFIVNRLPRSKELKDVMRVESACLYPPEAIRELVSNAMVHQELTSGPGPRVEIFGEDRIEITNHGSPLIDVDRFLDYPPKTRNEGLVRLMRDAKICEDRGSGVDKVVFLSEFHQLPPPRFRTVGDTTIASLASPRAFARMSREDRVRACYLHAALKWVSGEPMTNASLRQRFSISEKKYNIVSAIIADTIDAGLVRQHKPGRRYASYAPFWAEG